MDSTDMADTVVMTDVQKRMIEEKLPVGVRILSLEVWQHQPWNKDGVKQPPAGWHPQIKFQVANATYEADNYDVWAEPELTNERIQQTADAIRRRIEVLVKTKVL